MYGKLENGILTYAPRNYRMADGRLITNFYKSETLMKQYGFKPVEDKKPNTLVNTYYEVESYTELEDKIIINYIIREMPQVPNVEERLMSVEKLLLNLL